MKLPLPIHARGATSNPTPRFAHLEIQLDPTDLDPTDAQSPSPKTQLYLDATRSLITYNNSPDVGFDASINPYRGCEHGCSYCYARQTHEYLDLSAGLDFESKILVKLDAPSLLRHELSSKSWKPQPIAMAGVTDAYQPVDRKLQLARKCLQVLVEFRNPVVIITKSQLITRDIDLLSDLARRQAAFVYLSITTLDPSLSAKMEPRAASPRARLDTLRALSTAGIPVGALAAPIIPALNDHEIPAILAAAKDHGAITAGFTPVRLPLVVKDLFADWLTRHFPDRRDKILNRIREMRGGKLNDPNFNSRMRGQGVFAQQIRAMFKLAARRIGLDKPPPNLSTAHFRREGANSLFD